MSPFVFSASYNDQNPRRRQSRQQTTDQDDSGGNASSDKQIVISLYTNHTEMNELIILPLIYSV